MIVWILWMVSVFFLEKGTASLVVKICLRKLLTKKLTRDSCRQRSARALTDRRRNWVLVRRKAGRARKREIRSIKDTWICIMAREGIRGYFGVLEPVDGCKLYVSVSAKRAVWAERSDRAGRCRVRRQERILRQWGIFFCAVRPWRLWKRESTIASKRAGMEKREIELPDVQRVQKEKEICKRWNAVNCLWDAVVE